jgi:hypothetical protein
MKILILLIYSENNIYKQMMELQRKYIHKFAEVESYFIQMRENQTQELVIENDIIYVKGEEKYLNILYKTIKSIEYLFGKKNYDFLIRTNISTFINIPKLLEYFKCMNTEEHLYTGGTFFWNLHWIDPKSGILDKSLWGTRFMGGTSITFSSKTVHHIINNTNNLKYNVVDDISFGIYIQTYLPEAIKNGEKRLSQIYYTNIEKKEELINSYMNYEFYRNWHCNRNNDLIMMELLFTLLYKNI